MPNVVEIDGVQYMVFECFRIDWNIYMAKSVNWVDWEVVGLIYTSSLGYFDYLTQANPSLYKADDDYYIIIFNGQPAQDQFDLGILHSNNVESGWKRLQDVPVLSRGVTDQWDDTRIEGGTTYYVRSYATNETGTSYGANVSFTTPDNSKLRSAGKVIRYNGKTVIYK